MKLSTVSCYVARHAVVLFERFEDTLMPPRCAFCGLDTDRANASLCRGCRADLPWQASSCPRCALPLSTPLSSGASCATCQSDPPPYAATVAPLEYAFPVDAAIKALKFQRRLFYVPAFARLLVEATPKLPPGIDSVVAVPLHRWRQLGRGFNQARELAVPVARALDVPLLENVRRRVATPYQSSLSARRRRRNLAAAFEVRGPLRTAHPLIVDDVITTGATCRQLARTLLDAGAGEVSVLAVARA